MQEIDVRTTIPAGTADVWRLLGDSSTWPSWTAIEAFELERPGTQEDGTGEIRVFTTGRYVVREEIVERDAERRLSYALLSGLPLEDYRADIDLTPTDGGTELRWHTTFRPKLPGSGWVFRRALASRTQAFVDGLARASVS
jgi:uncharacterized protein YndB with AHSA1/START domain